MNCYCLLSDWTGPYKLAVDVVNLTRSASGDFALFVDEDGSGYVVYSADFVMTLELLTPDFLHSTGITANANVNGSWLPSSWFPEYFVEAPSLFKRNGIVYAVFGHCCCFCERTLSSGCSFCLASLAFVNAVCCWHVTCMRSHLALLACARRGQWLVCVHRTTSAGTVHAAGRRQHCLRARQRRDLAVECAARCAADTWPRLPIRES